MLNNTSEKDFEAHLRRFFLEMATVKKEENRNIEDVDSFLFHIKDCIHDLRKLCELRDAPLEFDELQADQIMQGIVYHTLPHLIAAARLYDYVPDILRSATDKVGVSRLKRPKK